MSWPSNAQMTRNGCSAHQASTNHPRTYLPLIWHLGDSTVRVSACLQLPCLQANTVLDLVHRDPHSHLRPRSIPRNRSWRPILPRLVLHPPNNLHRLPEHKSPMVRFSPTPHLLIHRIRLFNINLNLRNIHSPKSP